MTCCHPLSCRSLIIIETSLGVKCDRIQGCVKAEKSVGLISHPAESLRLTPVALFNMVKSS